MLKDIVEATPLGSHHVPLRSSIGFSCAINLTNQPRFAPVSLVPPVSHSSSRGSWTRAGGDHLARHQGRGRAARFTFYVLCHLLLAPLHAP